MKYPVVDPQYLEDVEGLLFIIDKVNTVDNQEEAAMHLEMAVKSGLDINNKYERGRVAEGAKQ